MDGAALRGRASVALLLAVELALLGAVAGLGWWWSDRVAAGPSGPDYVDIDAATMQPPDPLPAPGAATGTYSWSCGRGNHRNADNMVVSPQTPGAAQHVHDYVGNVTTDANSTDDSLAEADTTCDNGDRSAYYWPVLRVYQRAGAPRSEGVIQVPVSVSLTYFGSPVGPVLAMPRFMRASTGEAKAVTSGGRFARPSWTCASAPDRRTGKYPVCPPGDQVLRIFDFPSCWDGRRTDSPDHRSHIVFPQAGSCPHGTFAVPRMRAVIAYQLPHRALYAIDTFPDQRGSPLADHADLVNVASDELMAGIVRCLNAGLTCRAST
jgi:hypothetical protein